AGEEIAADALLASAGRLDSPAAEQGVGLRLRVAALAECFGVERLLRWPALLGHVVVTSSESNNRAVDIPSAAARRCSVSIRGVFSPVSKALIALCRTPTRFASSSWEIWSSVLARRMRSPSVARLSLMLLAGYTSIARVVNTVG